MKKYKREKRLDYYVALVNETSEKRKELTRLVSFVDNELINIYKKKNEDAYTEDEKLYVLKDLVNIV